MLQVTERLANIHFEHLIWFNELHSYQEEIRVYLKRIKGLMHQYTDTGITKELEHFREEFQEILNQIDGWRITIGKHEVRISDLAKLDGALSQMTNSQHEKMREHMNFLRKSVIEFKELFQYFMMNRM